MLRPILSCNYNLEHEQCTMSFTSYLCFQTRPAYFVPTEAVVVCKLWAFLGPKGENPMSLVVWFYLASKELQYIRF
uniref:Uncharacterized protein n=1 Tax=Arundo donax TaxID=35708 RepID=A0A0A9HRU6_ARUDO